MPLLQCGRSLRGSKHLFCAFDKEEHTMTREIDIKSKEQVDRINRLACEAPYEVWLSTDTVMLDARSLLGLYALVGKRARVVTEDDLNPRMVDRLVTKMR